MRKIGDTTYLTEKEAAYFLGVTYVTLVKRRYRNQAPPYIVFEGRHILYLKDELEKWVADNLESKTRG